ncbi:MAG: hypothetical protein AAGC44_07210 [Planctomycetota bacterium]
MLVRNIVLVLACVLGLTAVMPGIARADQEPAQRTVRVHADAPATNYGIEIVAVWQIEDELWVVSQIVTKGDIGGHAITPVSDQVTVNADETLSVKHYIAGKTWNWWRGVECTFINSPQALLRQMKEDEVEIDAVLFGLDPDAEE